MAAVTRDERMHQQWRQRKIVNAVCFGAVAKVRQILSVGNIGLGDHDGIGLCTLDDQAKQPDELMSLGQIDTG